MPKESTKASRRLQGRLTLGLDRYFEITKRGSAVKTEVRAGITTFLTMAYILFVNPTTLGQAIKIPGVDLMPELLTTTALASAFASMLMALLGRYPLAVAPGMGLNAYFAFTVVLGQGVAWQTALGGVFISGIIFFIISVTRLREMVFNAIPVELKHATAAGIGLFLAMIGLTNSGLVVAHPATLVTMGNLNSSAAMVTIAGIFTTAALMIRKVRGAVLFGILVATAIAIMTGAPVFNGKSFGGFPEGIIAAPVWPSHLVGAMDLSGAMAMGLIHIVFTFTIMEFFDTAGTLVGIADKAGMLDKRGNIPHASRVFASDATANIAGAALGTSPMTAYIESAAGIEEGGRTGLMPLVVAGLFLCSVVLWPIAGVIPANATAPALIIIGSMMTGSLARIKWDSILTSFPCFLTLAMMPLTYSISNGIAAGILSWCGIHLLAGRARDVHWLMYALAGVLLVKGFI